MFTDQNQNRIKYALIILCAILIIVVLGMLYKTNKELKTEQSQITMPLVELKSKPLTQEQIDKAFAKGENSQPLTQEQIKKAMEIAK